MKLTLISVATAFALVADPTAAQFSSFEWTPQATTGANGTSLLQGDVLHVVGSDENFLDSHNWQETVAPADGTFVCDLEFENLDFEDGYDAAYYYINCVCGDNRLCDKDSTRRVEIHVQAGDRFGLGVNTEDGFGGPGIATYSRLVFVPDDCNGNGQLDADELAAGTLVDLDGNGLPDSCEIALGIVPDCDADGIRDDHDPVELVPNDPGTAHVNRPAIAAWDERILVAGPRQTSQTEPESVLVYRSAGNAWVVEATLEPGDGLADIGFGESLAFDGIRAIVGAPRHPGVGTGTGSAYVFVRSDSTWIQEAQLFASDGGSHDQFGMDVDIAQAGNWVAVGAPRHSGPNGRAGAAYVYMRVDSIWTEIDKVTGSDAVDGDDFGRVVGIEAARLVVGSGDGGASTPTEGAVYSFAGNASLAWVEIQKIKPSSDPLSGNGSFGSSLSIARTLNPAAYWLAVGAPDRNEAAGEARVYASSVTVIAQFAQVEIFESTSASQPGAGVPERFGSSVDVRKDRVWVGAPGADGLSGTDVGAVEEFGLIPIQTFGWEHRRRVEGRAAGREFGDTVALGTGLYAAGSRTGQVEAVADLRTGLCPLNGVPSTLSASVGGEQALSLGAGADQGGRLYLLLGSLSGTTPGLALGTDVVPLNVDAYFFLTLTSPNAQPLSGSLGLLDTNGTASATVSIGPTSKPAYIGLHLRHAYLVVDPALPNPIAMVSNPLGLVLAP